MNDKNPLIAKFASSAAHVSGRKLVAGESVTWIKEHFHETLGDLKTLFDGFFISGVNHIFYLRKVPWKIFRDINIVGTDYKPLDASKWNVVPSGLLGPVRLTAVRPTSVPRKHQSTR